MKAEVKYTYDEQELLDIMVDAHEKIYPAPIEMKWVAKFDNYPNKVIITAIFISMPDKSVKKTTEEEEEETLP